LFKKSVDMVYFAKQGLITIGDGIDSGRYTSYNARETYSFHDKTLPLPGDMGIKDALDKKILRQAMRSDFIPIYKYFKKGTPPVNMESVLRKAYVIEKEFIIPADLAGGHSVTLILQKGVPFPKGDKAHSCIFDLNTNTPYGTICHFY
jgi:hypothetical protein